MKFYHGTRNKDLKELTTEHRSGKIYLTDSYAMAFLYAASPIRNWKYDKEKDVLTIVEGAPKMFEKMYGGKECYIFTCETDDFTKIESHPSGHTFLTSHNVTLEEREDIPDAYQKLMELAKNKTLNILRFEEMTNEERESRKRQVLKLNTLEIMKKEKENFPEEYELLIYMCPELELED